MASVAQPTQPPAEALPRIPLVALGGGGMAALVDAERARADALVDIARRDYGTALFALGEALSRRWLEKTDNPYLGELDDIAQRIGRRGAYLLNLSYEWLCTTGVGPDPAGEGSRLLRTLDWALDGLGRHVVVACQDSAVGLYYNVTWPGFVGVATAMAPGRFSAALNQAPMRRAGLPLPLDWLRNRIGVWRSHDLPPAHLLRKVFDTCATYDGARAMLRDTPICLPAIFALSGGEAGEGCIIERATDRAVVHEAPACAANHWQAPGLAGMARGFESANRQKQMESQMESQMASQMESLRDHAGDGFAWVRPPILNACTRLAVAANAARATLDVLGFEAGAPATAVFRL